MKFEAESTYRSTWTGKLVRRLLFLFSLLLILGVMITLGLQVPAVQEYVCRKSEAYLENKLGHPVRIAKVKLERLSWIGLDHFYIEGAHQDTVLYAGHVQASIDMSIIDLFKRKLSIHHIVLDHIVLDNSKRASDSLSNVEVILQKLFPSGSTTTKKNNSSLDLDLKSITLNDIKYYENNDRSSTAVSLDQGVIEINHIQLFSKNIEVKTLRLVRPAIMVHQKLSSTQSSGYNIFDDTISSFKIHQLEIVDGSFKSGKGHRIASEATGMQSFKGINIRLDSIRFIKGQLQFISRGLKFTNDQGMGIQNLIANHILVDRKHIQLAGFDLHTNSSHLADSLLLSFDSFKDFTSFNDKVKLNIDLKDAQLSLEELLFYIPSFAKNRFINNHKRDKIFVEGKINGTLNDLRSNKLRIRFGDHLQYNGKVECLNITRPEETFLALRIDNLNIKYGMLHELIKGIDKLKNFERLGTLSFRGNFDGSLKDFVAYGILNTDLGSSKMDMRLNLKNGLDRARYSGEIELNDFDLQRWSGDPALGKISGKATVTEGIGLQGSNLSANLNASIKMLEYKGYTYSNALFNGTLKQRLLDGVLTIKDSDADLDFKGKLDFTNEIPAYDFVSKIRTLDLNRLHLSKSPFKLSGDLDISLRGKRIEDLVGQVDLKAIKIYQDSSLIELNHLNLNASSDKPGNQNLKILSDWVDGEINGKYTLNELWPSLKNQLSNQFPEIAHSLKLDRSKKLKLDTALHQDYQFNFLIKDVKGLSTLLHQKISSQAAFKIDGVVQDQGKYVLTNWNIPNLTVNDLVLLNSVGRFEAKGGIAYASSYIDSTVRGDLHMPHMVLTADLSHTKMNFSIKTPKVTNLFNNVSLNGTVQLLDSTWYLKFGTSQVSFMDRNWDILSDNEVAFRPGYLQTKNLKFVNGKEKIEFVSVGNKGLRANISQLDIGWANQFSPLKGWRLNGKLNMNASVDDLFELKGLKVAGQVDSLLINKTYFGLLDLNAFAPNISQPIHISTSILDGTNQLMGQGFYDVAGNFSGGIKNNYQFKLLFKDYPLRFFEFLIDDIIDNTKGSIVGHLDIKKVNGKPDFAGKVQIKAGGLKINYLGTSYLIGSQLVMISNTQIDATGVQLKDELGNSASITGGFIHDRFNAFRVNAGITSNRFLVLKTTKDQNPDYYGTLIGDIVARFNGPFSQIDIDVKGATARPTVLNIPISETTVTTKDRIVQYRPKTSLGIQDTIKRRRILASRGISVGIDLTVNNNAEIALIFDEKLGDVLKGKGNGDIQMRFERNGDIKMYGNYEVDEGEYLFTLLSVVNKPFAIKQGGTIRWNGDPFGAEIDLDAEYKGLTSSLINLLPEYEGAIESSELRTQSAVDLSMHLFGALFKPEISFNLDIPNLTGNLRSIVDGKLSLLKADQNALNQQVLGLMVWGSFLPPNQLVASSGVIGSTINNLSQFISNQLSLLVENALRELVVDNDVISGFDFDVNYYNNNNAVDITTVSVFDELNINLGPKFFEDRLSVGFGANFVNTTQFDRLITPHFEVEYAFTKDRRLKIKAYARKDDIIQGQLKDRIGGGITWRKEFDSIKDFKKKLKEDLDQKSGGGTILQ